MAKKTLTQRVHDMTKESGLTCHIGKKKMSPLFAYSLEKVLSSADALHQTKPMIAGSKTEPVEITLNGEKTQLFPWAVVLKGFENVEKLTDKTQITLTKNGLWKKSFPVAYAHAVINLVKLWESTGKVESLKSESAEPTTKEITPVLADELI